MFSARLVAFEPGGPRLESLLLDSVSWDAAFPLNDVSALSLSYPSVFDGAGLAGGPVEIAVEVSDGGAWVEPKNARFLSSEFQANLVAELDVPRFTLRGLGALLERCFVLRPDENPGKPYTADENDPKRNFLSATVGQILAGVVTEARAKYPTMLDGIALGFTAGKDSLGNDWDKLDSVAYSPDTDLLRILDDMVGRGVADWWMQGRTLHAVNAESAAVTRRLRLLLGDAQEAPLRATFENLATHVEVAGGDGKRWERTVPGATVPYGARVVRVSNQSVTTEGTALDLIARQQAQAVAPRREYTRAIGDTRRQPPFFAWTVGDWVEAENADGVYEAVRVFEAGISFDADAATLEARVTLNDRFVDASVRDAKRMQGITHGATQILGDGGIPSRVDKAVPAAPVGVTANSLGYWLGAVPLSSVDVSWQAVTTSVDGLELTGVDFYEVQVEGRAKRSAGTGVGFDGLQPSRIVAVQVRAVSVTGVAGRWSPVVEVLTANPADVLDPPTAPSLRSENGAITTQWDGYLQGDGEPYSPPRSFAYCLVEVQKVGTSTWTRYARDAGWTLIGLEVGDQWRSRLVAVDARGVESEPGPYTTVTINSQAQQAADAAAAATTTADGANARLAHVYGTPFPTTRVNETPLKPGDELVTRKDGNAVEVRVWNGTDWTDSYLLSGQVFVLSELGTISLANGIVDTPNLKAGAVDSFQITSPLIQSSSEADRGIKWNGNSFVAYNDDGEEMIRLEGDTGEINGVDIIGATIKTSGAGDRVELSAGITRSSMRLIDATENLCGVIGWTQGENEPGIWLKDSSGTSRSTLIDNRLQLNGTGVSLIVGEPRGTLVKVDYATGLYAWLSSGTGGYNVRMTTGFKFFYESSAEETKLGIEPLTAAVPDPYRLLEVTPVTWVDRKEMAAFVDARDWQATQADLGRTVDAPAPDMPEPTPGLVLEDMLAHGLEEFTLPGPIQPDGTRGPGTVLYDKAWLPLIPIVRDLVARVETLEKEPH